MFSFVASVVVISWYVAKVCQGQNQEKSINNTFLQNIESCDNLAKMSNLKEHEYDLMENNCILLNLHEIFTCPFIHSDFDIRMLNETMVIEKSNENKYIPRKSFVSGKLAIQVFVFQEFMQVFECKIREMYCLAKHENLVVSKISHFSIHSYVDKFVHCC